MTPSEISASLSYAVENSNMRAADRRALDKMKEIEAKHRRKLKTIRIDSRTVIAATSDRMKELKKHYGV